MVKIPVAVIGAGIAAVVSRRSATAPPSPPRPSDPPFLHPTALTTTDVKLAVYTALLHDRPPAEGALRYLETTG
jgi:hypothetical protein